LKTARNIIAIAFIVITIAINHLAPNSFIEEFYYNYIFQAIRRIYKATIYHLPFAFSYIILPAIIVLITSVCRKALKAGYSSFFKTLALFIGLIYSSFMWMWGFNYRLPTVEDKLQLHSVPIDSLVLINEIIIVQSQLITLRASIQLDTIALVTAMDFDELGNELFQLQRPLLEQMGYKSNYPLKIRKLQPAGSLLVFSTTGIYNPYSMEGHLDPGLFHVSYPFTAAHEMAHGYGVTDEGDCNFIALLTCLKAKNDYIKYSAYFSYYRYLMRDLLQLAPYSFDLIRNTRPPGLNNDLQMHYASLNRFPEIMPTIRDWIYDYYLKANGVTTGLDSYDRVVALSLAYQKKWGKII
jgi:hypothetical protein